MLNQSTKRAAKADATLAMSKATFDQLQSGQTSLDKAIDAGDIKVKGRREAAAELLGMLDDFPFWFNIVTP